MTKLKSKGRASGATVRRPSRAADAADAAAGASNSDESDDHGAFAKPRQQATGRSDSAWLYGKWTGTAHGHPQNVRESTDLSTLGREADSARPAGRSISFADAFLTDRTRESFAASRLGSLESAVLSNRQGSLAEAAADLARRPRPPRTAEAKAVVREATVGKFLDGAAEGATHATLEEPVCFRPCMRREFCKFFCHPAEYATRRKRAEADAWAAFAGGNNSGEHKIFGLPNFAEAGFSEHTEESCFSDMAVPNKLRLYRVLHRASSVSRLCLAQPKAQMPPDVPDERVMSAAAALVRCDHANILRCHEVCEDESCIYLLYEDVHCVALETHLRQEVLTEPVMAALSRQLFAATAFAQSLGLAHLGWTLWHVLLHVVSTGAAPVLKVFGFGLMGIFQPDHGDHVCYAPEAIEKMKGGKNFANRLVGAQRTAADSWSIGALVFVFISGRPPILGPLDELDGRIMKKSWRFTPQFDEVSLQAKLLVESLLSPDGSRRPTAIRALRHEWITGLHRPSVICHRELKKLVNFVEAPIAKRLFGRFLVKFLPPDHMLRLADAFLSLDQSGDGFITKADLYKLSRDDINNDGVIDADELLYSEQQLEAVCQWFTRDGAPGISLSRFAELHVEDLIDGSALRHAFESLDRDGSEEIDAHELLDALISLDRCDDTEIKLEDVTAYIEGMEGVAGEAGDANHQIDFNEFELFFPERTQRLKALAERMLSSRETTETLSTCFGSINDECELWLRSLKEILDKIQDLADRSLGNKKKAHELKEQMMLASDCLRHPPGPQDEVHLKGSVKEAMKAQRTAARLGKTPAGLENETYGFDDFLQKEAIRGAWPYLIAPEIKALAQTIREASDALDEDRAVDHFKAHDAAESALNKIKEVVEWAEGQTEEYRSFAEALVSHEIPMPQIARSGRGLQTLGDEKEGGAFAVEGDHLGAAGIGCLSAACEERLAQMQLLVREATSRAGAAEQ